MRKSRQPARIRHPDPGIELRLQRIIALQEAIARRQVIITEFIEQMRAARLQQDKASMSLRGSHTKSANAEFELNMAAQRERITSAGAGITEAEEFITARQEEIAKLAGELSDTDLSYL